MYQLGYNGKNCHSDAEPKNYRMRKLYDLKHNFDDPYDDLDYEPYVAHSDDVV